jgi:flagellar M-ring protein FliF
VRSNVTENPPNQQQTNTNTPTTSSRQSEVINYEVSEIVSKTIVPSGEVRKLSVAVLVDGTYQPGAKAGEAPKYTARTPEELATYREIVKGAVGFNETRGDRVEVASAPFEVRDDPDTGAFQAEATRLFWLHVGRYAAYFLLAVLCFLGVVRPLLRWITTREENAEPFVPRTVEELEASLEGREALPVGVGAAQLPAAAMADQAEPVDLRAQVLALVKAEPERAAEIIRFWLKKG